MNRKICLSLSRFFARNVPNFVKLKGAAYDSHTVSALRLLKQNHNIQFIKRSKPTIYRGISVEHCLGSLDYPGLGITTMRASLARFLKTNGILCLDDLNPSQKKELIDSHVNGYSFTKGNTKIAHSFTYCSSVALGFGLDASKKSNFPGIILIGAAYKDSCTQAWDVEYDPPDLDGEFGTSIFSYQCETIVPHLSFPINHCIIINQKSSDMIHLDDLTQAKRLDVTGESILELDIIPSEKMKKYQQLEIEKVIAFDDFATYVCRNASKTVDPAQAAELYEKYRNISKKQAELVSFPLFERDLWVSVASEVAPKKYTCISAHEEGFTLEVPAKCGGVLTIDISDIEAIICLAPLFEKDPTLTLDQVKNGALPCALNYLTECILRKNKDLICQSGLEQCVEDKENQKVKVLA
ncbi:hypothetical protein [Legionella parisiensis]|uniref:Uncharacterized protein n=1 Tax=Legionella parisiensis TaxID=45071 RepID=A0A1E5JKS8_9GAMM|nr:hypothetical protein [Legionella parisiensis]KTD43040.1 hypothetical protein Lpar_1017 [Legionella parisiensis]OEH45114.1 hypothetical protein lpari_03884 [Legionella parisiensis]STX77885.1 Uncharacterised protein [Legionella parisiensis]